MASKRLNVLVYSGDGASVESVRHCLYSLRRLLSPNYAVLPVYGQTILDEPWAESCALIVFPGGGDLGYCKTLNGAGNRCIKQYVNAGGAYLGLCAGGYYGSKRCEFEVGNKKMEVIGARELEFYPDTCRGSAFPGFVYNSEAGTKAATLQVNKNAFATSGAAIPETFRSYFNGGSVFVDAPQHEKKGVEVLANYTETLAVEPGIGSAAVVYCAVGDGSVVLTGPHPEFAAVNLSKDAKDMDPSVVDAIAEDDESRQSFFRACLLKLGMRVNQEQTIPSLSRMHLSAMDGKDIKSIMSAWKPILTVVDDEDFIKGENDTFHLQKPSSAWSMKELTKSAIETLIGSSKNQDKDQKETTNNFISQKVAVKNLLVHTDELPTAKDTPYFNHNAFFSNLKSFNEADTAQPSVQQRFGQILLYGEVVTSTSTILEKNSRITSHFPSGTVFTATTQIAGRGRGTNVWVAPTGALMFSFIVKHPLALNATAPVVFIQYIAAIAVAEAVQTYDQEEWSSTKTSKYRAMPIKLKWPNDIYILDPNSTDSTSDGNDLSKYAKIGGVLVNSSYSGGDYTLVVGIGLNVSNAAPTTSINAALNALKTQDGSQHFANFTLEKLLARILFVFSNLYDVFCRHGFSGTLEDLYYKHWLHSGQIVTLETEGGAKARVKGITRDWGLLLAEEVVSVAGGEAKGTGKTFALQTDSNSFDFFKGLLKRKEGKL